MLERRNLLILLLMVMGCTRMLGADSRIEIDASDLVNPSCNGVGIIKFDKNSYSGGEITSSGGKDYTPFLTMAELTLKADDGYYIKTIQVQYIVKGGETGSIQCIDKEVTLVSGRTIPVSSDKAEFICKNIAIYAIVVTYSSEATVTLTAGTGGSVSGGGSIGIGRQITIRATPNSGYHFTKWSDGNTDATRKITVNSDITLKANFAACTYTIEKCKSAATCTNPAVYGKQCSTCGVLSSDNYTVGSALGHDFTTQSPGPLYLSSEATCMQKARYYYICSRCEEKGTSTYEYGEKANHTYSSKTLASSAESNGLYSYLCNFGCGTKCSDKRVIKDYAAGSNLDLTVNGSLYTATSDINLTDANQFSGVNVSFSAPTSPTYYRSMANQWGTIVLPFDVTIDGVNQDFDFYSVSSVSANTLELTRIETTLAAGTPALIRMSEAAKNTSTGKYDLSITAANTTVNTSGALTATADVLTLTGSYAAKNISGEAGYIIANNTFWNIQSIKGENKVYNTPFRAYLAGLVANGAKQLTVSTDDITAVETIFSPLGELEGTVYDLNGRRLNDLQKGVNIVKRGDKTFKVIIK